MSEPAGKPGGMQEKGSDALSAEDPLHMMYMKRPGEPSLMPVPDLTDKGGLAGVLFALTLHFNPSSLFMAGLEPPEQRRGNRFMPAILLDFIRVTNSDKFEQVL